MIQVCKNCASIIRAQRPAWIEVPSSSERVQKIFKVSTDSCCACKQRVWPNHVYTEPAFYFEGPLKTRIREKAEALVKGALDG